MRVFRVSFHNQGKVYELYAKRVQQGELFGFIELSDLVFEEASALLVDPSTERLRSELKGVARMMVPIHSVVRIDEVEKEGPAKIHELSDKSNVTQFPVAFYPPRSDPKG
jgi:hypothetical protein